MIRGYQPIRYLICRCSISYLIWHICSLTIIDATVLSSLWSVPFQLQVSLIRSSEYALGFLDLSQGLRVLRGIPGSLRQLTEVLSQNLAVKTSRKPSTVEETLRFHTMIPLFFYRTHSTDLLTGALQLTSLRRGEVPKVSITWDTLAPRRWWHEDFTCWVRELWKFVCCVFRTSKCQTKWYGDGNTLLATKLHCIGNMIMPDKRESQRTEDIQRQE